MPAVMQVGSAEQSDRTMIDALAPALKTLPDGVVAAARGGANVMAKMTRAKLGRSSYLSLDKLEGHVDPGAEGVHGCLPIWRGFETNLGK